MRERLTAEWALAARGSVANSNGQPVLIEDRGGETGRFGDRSSTHLYVIWDDWDSLTQQERSEIIMDAFENTHDDNKVMKVTIAMGLTATEADRMGLSYKVL